MPCQFVRQSGGDEAPDDERRCRVDVNHVVGDATILTAFGEGPVDGLDDVASHTEVAQDWLGFRTDHPMVWACSRGEIHAPQLLQPADGETARLRIALARIVRPQVDEASVIGRHPDRRVEARPALCFHLPRESGADFMLGPGAKLGRDPVRSPRA